jgi:hypothetical protein
LRVGIGSAGTLSPDIGWYTIQEIDWYTIVDIAWYTMLEIRQLEGISTIEQANEYLERYLPNVHNPNYMVQAQNPISAYEALPTGCDLNQIFCMKEYRVVGKDHTISVDALKWMISDPLKHSIARQLIEIRFDKYGKWEAYFAGRKIKLTLVQKLKKAAA